MPLHLIKLSVGSEDVDGLLAWQERLALAQAAIGAAPNPFHDTRMSPKRGAELLAGGSIYWVIKRKIRCRQRIEALEQLEDENGKSFCRIVLDPKVVRTELRTKRPFQGWRYLNANDAPPDIGGNLDARADSLDELEQALKEACVW